MYGDEVESLLSCDSTLERFVVPSQVIARASRLYRPRPRARPREHGELFELLRAAAGRLNLQPAGQGLLPVMVVGRYASGTSTL